MNPKIAIFGSAVSASESVEAKAREVGGALAEHDPILITGACSGLPYEAVIAPYQKSHTEIWGFSAATDYDGQVALTPNDDNTIYTRLTYVPKDFEFAGDPNVARKYRNVLSTAHCDAGIILAGRWGSLNEFTNLYDMGKVIGVLTGTGGVADELAALDQKIHKPGKAVVLFDDSPQGLVKKVMDEVSTRLAQT